MSSLPNLLGLATELRDKAGIVAIAIRPGKSPATPSWKEFRQRPPTDEEFRRMFPAQALRGIAVLCGDASQGLYALDFDDHGVFAKFLGELERLRPQLLPSLPIAITPSGGRHIYFRSNQSLRIEELAKSEKGEELIRLLANGSYAIVPPTPDGIHPAGGAYQWVQGDLFSVPLLDEDTVEDLLAIARSLDKRRPEPIRLHFEGPPAVAAAAERVGDRYNKEADVPALLTAHGWKYAGKGSGDNHYYTRPGKSAGTSGTWNEELRCFYCFSSNAHPLEAGKAYSPFALYAFLECSGDFHEAARRLAQQFGLDTPKKGQSPSVPAVFLADEEGEKETGAREEAPEPPICPLSVVPPRPLEWLIPGLLSRGDHTILAGDPGVGKTMFALELAHGLTTGESVQGREIPRKARVGWIGIDMDISDVAERYRTLYGEPNENFLALSAHVLEQYGLLPLTEENLPTWVRLIRSYQLDALVIDTLLDFVQPRDNDKAHEVRQCMELVKQLALKAGVAILSIAHTRKGAGKQSPMSLLGSTLYGAKAECVAFLDKDLELGVTRLTVPKLRRRGEFPGNYELTYLWQNDRFVPVEVEAPERLSLEEEVRAHIARYGPISRQQLIEDFGPSRTRSLDKALAKLGARGLIVASRGGWRNSEVIYSLPTVVTPVEADQGGGSNNGFPPDPRVPFHLRGGSGGF